MITNLYVLHPCKYLQPLDEMVISKLHTSGFIGDELLESTHRVQTFLHAFFGKY